MSDLALDESNSARAATNAPLRRLLVLDTSYTLEMVRDRGLDAPILSRDLDGYFDHVWSVHPFATLLTSDEWGARYGKPDTHQFAGRHTVIEGKVGRFRSLSWIPPLNFLLGQADLFLRLWRLIRREDISAVRAPGPLYTGLFGLALARVAGVPLVVRVGANFDELREFTGKPVEGRIFRSRRVEKAVERFVFRRADLVAGANQDNLDFAIASGARPERSTLFRYGNLIDPRHFEEPVGRQQGPELIREIGLDSGPFIISVGRLEDVAAVKHPDDIVRLLALLRARGVRIKAVWVGDGPLRQRVLELSAELGVQDHFVLAGNRDQDWLARVYPLAAVHACTQAGRALSEAALAALPTVAYDVDWQRELIVTGETGVLVGYRDWQAMAAAIEHLLKNPGEAARLGSNLRRRAMAMLDPATLVEHERREYEKLLDDADDRR